MKSAKHHYGATCLRGGRISNEDTHQAGTIEMPAFAKRQPVSLTHGNKAALQGEGATSESGDPQIFYFGVFDGHGGSQCAEFLRDRLHTYLEDSAIKFRMQSTLQEPTDTDQDHSQVLELQRNLVNTWRDFVGGYFRRFRPQYFSIFKPTASTDEESTAVNSIQATLMYSFLHADLDFTAAQASKHSPTSASTDDPVLSDRPLNDNDILSSPARPASQNLTNMLNAPIGGHTRFQGGSTASIALISTPTPTPFWNPASPATLVTAHCGDTRILLCRVSDGQPVPLTTNHHPSTPVEATRLRRFAATFVTDSFGEERILGLANTRSFGDISSKRIGVSAEPEIRTTHMEPSEYSFMVLVSDGVTASLDDQEIVDIIKEAKTPERAAAEVVAFATEVAGSRSDNATAVVVRLGGWERRGEGGGGSIGTKEMREWKKLQAEDPRASRQ